MRENIKWYFGLCGNFQTQHVFFSFNWFGTLYEKIWVDMSLTLFYQDNYFEFILCELQWDLSMQLFKIKDKLHLPLQSASESQFCNLECLSPSIQMN